MNIDILKKLVRLANNNPNEHEANAAARKVCRILEENNFSLEERVVNKEPNNTYAGAQGSGTTSSTWWNIYNQYRNAHQSGAKEKNTYEGDAYRYSYNWYWEKNEYQKQREREQKTEHRDYGAEYYDPATHDWINPLTGKRTSNRKRKAHTSRRMKCKTCGESKDTLFVGREEVFECPQCQWTAYTKK